MACKFGKTVISTGLFLVIFSSCTHNVTGLEGQLFYLGFLDVTSSDPVGIQEIFVMATSAGRVRIQYNAPLNYNETITLSSINNYQYSKTITQELAPYVNQLANFAIIISSEMPISVQANKAKQGTGDGYLALPITTDSKRFYLASYTPFSPSPAQFMITSPFNDTCLSVSYILGTQGYRIMHLSMNANDVFRSSSLDFDYTGVYISSSQPIAVYSGLDCAFVPKDVLYCDHIIEQVPPTTQWGSTFIMASFAGRPPATGFRIRVIAQEPIDVTYTYIQYDSRRNPSTPVVFQEASLVRGEWDEAAANFSTTNPYVVVVNCSYACLVMQYATGFEILGDTGPGEVSFPDPFMVTVPPLDHYTNNQKFSTSRNYWNSTVYDSLNFVTIIAKTANLSQIYLDGTSLLALSSNPSYVKMDITYDMWAGYSVVSLIIKAGFHAVFGTDPNVMFAVFVYGYGIKDKTGYGYLAGYRYLYDNNEKPVLPSGPYAVFNTITVATTTPMPSTAPASPITILPSDVPYYVMRFVGRYFNFYLKGNLITAFCSKGYARYFNENRLTTMNTTIQNTINSKCSVSGGSIEHNLTTNIYSEYTAGVIEITLKLSGTGSATLRDLYSCVDDLTLIVTNIATWVPGYTNSRDVLKNDATYTAGCDVVHFMPESFPLKAAGWLCPKSTVAAISASNLIRIDFLLCLLTILGSVLAAVRRT